MDLIAFNNIVYTIRETLPNETKKLFDEKLDRVLKITGKETTSRETLAILMLIAESEFNRNQNKEVKDEE